MLKNDADLAGKEVSFVGLSQGNLVARGVIQSCDAVTVKNYISIGGPQAGNIHVYIHTIPITIVPS